MNPFDENENASPEFEQEENQALIDMLAKIAPAGALEGATDEMGEHFKNSVAKLGRLGAISGQSFLRAAIGLVEAPDTNGSLIGTLFFSLDRDHLIHEGKDLQEVENAITMSFGALKEYFDSLGNAIEG